MDERSLPLPPRAQELARLLREGVDDDAWVWHDPARQPLPESELDALLVFAAHEAGLPRPERFSGEALREAYITYLFRAGIDPSTIDTVVGYLTPSTKVRFRSLASSARIVNVDPGDTLHPATR